MTKDDIDKSIGERLEKLINERIAYFDLLVFIGLPAGVVFEILQKTDLGVETIYRLVCLACQYGSPYSRNMVCGILLALRQNARGFDATTATVLRLQCLTKLVWYDRATTGGRPFAKPTWKALDEEAINPVTRCQTGDEQSREWDEEAAGKIIYTLRYYSTLFHYPAVPFEWSQSLMKTVRSDYVLHGYEDAEVTDDEMQSLVEADMAAKRGNNDYRAQYIGE
jgi:hypothetical protein